MNRFEKEIMIERSLPVSARVDLISLARVGMFIESLGGDMPRSLSQLVNWAVKMLDDVIGDRVQRVDRLSDALLWLEERGYRQLTTRKRASMKLPYALAAENLRDAKMDPRVLDKYRYETIHHRNKDVYRSEIPESKNVLLATPEEVRHKVDEVKRRNEEIKRLKEQAIQAAKSQGLIAETSDTGNNNDDVEDIVETSDVPTVSEKMTDDEYERKCSEISKRDEEQRRLESELLSPERLRQLAGTTSRDNDEDDK